MLEKRWENVAIWLNALLSHMYYKILSKEYMVASCLMFLIRINLSPEMIYSDSRNDYSKINRHKNIKKNPFPEYKNVSSHLKIDHNYFHKCRCL